MKQHTTHQRPRLSGRQQELVLLWDQFEESAAGRLRVALVAGEPGIGKTRLRRLLTITLGPLATTEMATIAARMLGAPLDQATRGLLAIGR